MADKTRHTQREPIVNASDQGCSEMAEKIVHISRVRVQQFER